MKMIAFTLLNIPLHAFDDITSGVKIPATAELLLPIGVHCAVLCWCSRPMMISPFSNKTDVRC